MSGSFRVRNGLQGQGHNGNSHEKKKKKKEEEEKKKITLIDCLRKVVALLNANADSNAFFLECVRQKIRDICWLIMGIYGDEIPTVMVKGQSPAELIKVVRNWIASDGTIGGAVRAEIVEGLNAVLAMING